MLVSANYMTKQAAEVYTQLRGYTHCLHTFGLEIIEHSNTLCSKIDHGNNQYIKDQIAF